MGLRKSTKLATAGAILAAGLAGGGVASAATATLTITPTEENNGHWYVSVSGTTSGVYSSGFSAVFRLWGEDFYTDDLRAGPDTSTFWPFETSFGYTWRVGSGELNEDWEGRDELYAGVRIFANGRQQEKAETNRVYGNWAG